jgi:hypothetical protein
MNMFGRKFKPEEIAEQLHAVVLEGTTLLGAYERFVRPDEAERTRMLFSAQLFPVAASFAVAASVGRAATATNANLKDAFLQAHVVYLDLFADQDQLVRVGDYLIWRIERDLVARVLRERFCQVIIPSVFDAHEIRYGMLLRVVSDIRKEMFCADIERGVSLALHDPEQGFMMAFMSAATTFTRQVLNIDPNDPALTDGQRERFQMSGGYAGTFLMQSYFKVIDVFKSITA